MQASMLYMCGLLITLAASGAVVIYLRSPLEKILSELCGTPERAKFWTAFSNVTLILVPVIFAMQYQPAASVNPIIGFELADQVKWGLIGLVLSAVVLAWVLGRFIPRAGRPGASAQTAGTAPD
jgi:hypothetical protein